MCPEHIEQRPELQHIMLLCAYAQRIESTGLFFFGHAKQLLFNNLHASFAFHKWKPKEIILKVRCFQTLEEIQNSSQSHRWRGQRRASDLKSGMDFDSQNLFMLPILYVRKKFRWPLWDMFREGKPLKCDITEISGSPMQEGTVQCSSGTYLLETSITLF